METFETELKNRNKNLQNLLKENNLDAYVITDPEDVWYFSNIAYSPEQRPFFFIAFPNKKPLFIVPKLEESHVDVSYLDYDLATYFDVTSKPGDNWYDVLQDYLNPLDKIGIEQNSPLFVTNSVDAHWVVADYVKELRTIKSDYEVAKIEAVAKLTSSVVRSTLDMVKTGTTVGETFQVPFKYHQEDLDKFKESHDRTQNAVWPADYSYMPHSAVKADSVIGEGANVDIAIFKLDGYAAECERTFFTEEPSEEAKEYFNIMMEARKIMLDMLRPGVKASSIEEKVMDYLESRGVADKVLHRPGHGLGLNNHEDPTISRGNDTLLTENMVISVEPGLYVKGLGGFRHSDSVLITSDGYRILTEGPTELEDLILG